MEELVSVIVPIYKVEKYLQKCIDSIRNQTYSKLEIILIDDGSPDNCPKICDEYAALDSRIKVIHKANGGLSDARNAGIDAATGKWIMFVDSDDYIDRTMVYTLHLAVSCSNAQIAVCGVKLFDDDSNPNFRTEEWLSLEAGIFSGMEILKSVQKGGIIAPALVVAWNKIYDKQLFCDIRYPKGRVHEDEYIIHKLYAICNKIVCLTDALYFYRQRPLSIMNNHYNSSRLDLFNAWAERISFYESHDLQYYSSFIQDAYFWTILQKYFLVENNKENRNRLKECRTTTKKVLGYYCKRQDISWKSKLAMCLFSYAPNTYKLIFINRKKKV